MSYDNHLNGALFFYQGTGKGCLQLRAGNNKLMKRDAILVYKDEAWQLVAGTVTNGNLRPEYAAKLIIQDRGKLKATATLYRLGDETPIGPINVWVAETDDGCPYLQVKPRSGVGADRRLPL